MYTRVGRIINDQFGHPFLSIEYCPSGQEIMLLDKICGFLNKEQETKESENFSALAHKMSVHDEYEDDEPDFYPSQDYMDMYKKEFDAGGNI